jgi:hypothetical protein
VNFKDRQELISYLTSDPKGRSVLWECLDYGFPPHIPRQKVLVKAYRDGLVEAYGSEVVDVKIVLLGRSTTFPEHEIEQDRILDESLPEVYREIHFPGYEKDSALRGFD